MLVYSFWVYNKFLALLRRKSRNFELMESQLMDQLMDSLRAGKKKSPSHEIMDQMVEVGKRRASPGCYSSGEEYPAYSSHILVKHLLLVRLGPEVEVFLRLLPSGLKVCNQFFELIAV